MKSTALNSALIAASGVWLMSTVSTITVAQAQDALSVGNNESIFVDGKSLKIIRGKAKGDVLAELKKLNAREIGPGALIIRSGDKLYIADMVAEKPAPQTTGMATPDTTRTAAYEPARVSAYVNDPNRPQTYEPGRVSAYVNDPNRPQTYEPGRVSALSLIHI